MSGNCQGIENLIHIGIVLNYRPDFKIGTIMIIGALDKGFEFTGESMEQFYGFFKIEDCETPIHFGKVVFCRIDNDKEFQNSPFEPNHWSEIGSFWICDIEDFNPERKGVYINMEIIESYGGENILELIFSENPSLFDFVLENEIYDSHLYHSISDRLKHVVEEIEVLKNYLQEFKNFDLKKAIDDYIIEIEEYSSGSRPGKDEWVALYMVSRRKYWKDDPYLNKYLIIFNRQLDRDSGYAPCSRLGNWDETQLKEYERQKDNLRSEYIEMLKESYNSASHLKFLMKSYKEKIRTLKGKVLNNYKKNDFFF